MSQKSIIIIQIHRDKILLAEYAKGKAAGESIEVSLPIAADKLYGDPVKAGQEICRQIASNGIKAKCAIVIPQPSEVLMKDVNVPPLSDKSMLKGVVNSRMQRELKLAPGDMALDFTGEVSGQEQKHIIIAGLQNKRIYAMQSMVENANLDLEAIVPGDAALFLSQIDVSADENIIYVDGYTAKIVIVANGGVRYIASVNSFDGNSQLLAHKVSSEIMRNPVVNSLGCSNFRVAAKDPEFIDFMKDSFGSEHTFSSSTIAYSSIADSIAEIYFAGKGFKLNLTDNHFAEKVNPKLAGNIRKAVIVCAGVLLFVGWFFYDWNQDKIEIADCQQMIDGLQANVDVSQEIIDKVNKAKQWCGTETYYSECLKQITVEFPEQSSIWANSLALDKDFIGVMTGSSTSKQTIEQTLNRMVDNPGFTDVKLLYIRQAGKSTTELSFAMQFRYNIN